VNLSMTFRRKDDSGSVGLATHVKVPKVKKLLVSTDVGLIELELNFSANSVRLGKLYKRKIAYPSKFYRKALIDSISGYCLNLSLLDVNFNCEFIFGFVIEIIKVIKENPIKPASALKILLFSAMCLSLDRTVPQEGKWIRHPTYRKGVSGHRKSQRKYNFPSDNMQYYLLELANICPQHAQSLFRPFELIPNLELDYDINSIIKPNTADTTTLTNILDSLPNLLDHMTSSIDLDPCGRAQLYASYQRGPNGISATSWEKDRKAIGADPKLEGALYYLLYTMHPEVAGVVLPYGISSNECESKEKSNTECQGISEPDTSTPKHSLLTFIPDGKFGKTRTIAVCDQISQTSMSGINSVLMEILDSLRNNDLTFRQEDLPNYICYYTDKNYSNLPASADSTTFTDRLPSELNCKVVEYLFGNGIGSAWKEIVCNRNFTATKAAYDHGIPNNVKYSTGTPMGLMTSWSTSAIVHHLIVRYCCMKLNAPYHYIILGDDVCIWNRKVYDLYYNTMQKLGMELSSTKSTNSEVYCEFAKRTFKRVYNDKLAIYEIVEMTGLPGAQSAKIYACDLGGTAGFISQLYQRQSVLRNSKFLKLGLNRPANGAVVLQCIKLLAYLYHSNVRSFNCAVNFISLWTFSSLVDNLVLPVRIPKGHWQTLVTNVISSVHKIHIDHLGISEVAQVAEFLPLGSLPFYPLSVRMRLYQTLTTSDLETQLTAGTTKLLQFESEFSEDVSKSTSYQKFLIVSLLEHFAESLSAKVLDFLLSDTDMLSDLQTAQLFDQSTYENLIRLSQIIDAKTINRRKLRFIVDSKLGKSLLQVKQALNMEGIIKKYTFTDPFERYSNISARIKHGSKALGLSQPQLNYISYRYLNLDKSKPSGDGWFPASTTI